MSLMSKRRASLVMMLTGILAVAAGLCLSGYNLWDGHRAGAAADAAADTIIRHQKEAAEANTDKTQPGVSSDQDETHPGLAPDPDEAQLRLSSDPDKTQSAPCLDSDRELPVLEVDGYRYIGTVSIPALNAELPVQEDWSLVLLKSSPCRYKGSPYQGDLIICAHNYAAHFGGLRDLQPGDEVTFTDVEGNEFHYTVAELETLAGTAVEEMESGAWDLTLFTCTPGGQMRVTVRCDLLEDDEAQREK